MEPRIKCSALNKTANTCSLLNLALCSYSCCSLLLCWLFPISLFHWWCLLALLNVSLKAQLCHTWAVQIAPSPLDPSFPFYVHFDCHVLSCFPFAWSAHLLLSSALFPSQLLLQGFSSSIVFPWSLPLVFILSQSFLFSSLVLFYWFLHYVCCHIVLQLILFPYSQDQKWRWL